MLRVVFMGTPEFAVPALRRVAASHSVVAVYTQPDRPVGRKLELKAPPVKRVAQELGIPVFQPEKLSQPGEYEKLAEFRPDVIVVVAYGQILRRNVLELPRLGCVNIHSSLLPRWRGAAPIQWAILAGDAETGVSTMKLVEKLDAGDVYLESRTPIAPDETAGTLHDRLATLGAELIERTLSGLESGSLAARPQDESAVTYASKLSKEMESLDPAESAEVLERRVRALNPWPGTSVPVKSGVAPDEPPQRLRIKSARARRDIRGPSGRIFEQAGMVLLGTVSGALELLSLQWEGKREIGPGEFLNGLKGRGESLPLAIVPPEKGSG